MAEPWGLVLGTAIVAGALLGWPALVIMLAVVVLVQVTRGHLDPRLIFLVVALAALGAGRAAVQEPAVLPPDLADATGATVRVESLPRTSAAGESVLVSVQHLTFETEVRPVGDPVVLAWLPAGERVAPGDTLEVAWSIDPLEIVDPGYGSYVAARGAVAVGRIWYVENHQEGAILLHRLVDLRHRVSAGLQEVLPGDAGALASGIVTGDDAALSDEARDAFLYTGTTHITAVSGANVAMILAIWNLVIPAGRFRRLIAVQVLIIASIWGYAVLVGLEPPALRAAIMASLILLASRSGRRPDLLTLLALTSAAMVLWQPGYVHMVGFWLSIVATGAIVMRVPTAPGTGWRRLIRGTVEGVALAQIATLPVILVAFGTWSLTSIMANAILAPLIWLAFPLCFILAAVVVITPWLGPIVALAPLIPLTVALQVVDRLGSAMPPLDFTNAGLAGVVAVALPCIIGLLLLSNETSRWSRIVAGQASLRPITVSLVLIGPTLGVLVAIVIALYAA